MSQNPVVQLHKSCNPWKQIAINLEISIDIICCTPSNTTDNACGDLLTHGNSLPQVALSAIMQVGPNGSIEIAK